MGHPFRDPDGCRRPGVAAAPRQGSVYSAGGMDRGGVWFPFHAAPHCSISETARAGDAGNCACSDRVSTGAPRRCLRQYNPPHRAEPGAVAMDSLGSRGPYPVRADRRTATSSPRHRALAGPKFEASQPRHGLIAEGANILESERVTAPVTVGIVRPAILLPADWREWDQARLDAVLAHEQSHVRRRDPAVQFLSALHRALFWRTVP